MSALNTWTLWDNAFQKKFGLIVDGFHLKSTSVPDSDSSKRIHSEEATSHKLQNICHSAEVFYNCSRQHNQILVSKIISLEIGSKISSGIQNSRRDETCEMQMPRQM